MLDQGEKIQKRKLFLQLQIAVTLLTPIHSAEYPLPHKLVTACVSQHSVCQHVLKRQAMDTPAMKTSFKSRRAFSF